ncbi:MAG: hypothetical protein GXZ13_02675 [Synergistaceae bacterium]|jgi:hypothetical protein|nr:hypothetical protein [Synergistaceae bacterium]
MKKRISVLILSFCTLIAFGYSLGGLGGYLVGRGRPLMIISGLVIGTLSAILAFYIWNMYLDEIAVEDEKLRKNS